MFFPPKKEDYTQEEWNAQLVNGNDACVEYHSFGLIRIMYVFRKFDTFKGHYLEFFS